MVLGIFIRGFWLQTRIAIALFVVGLLFGLLAMTSCVSPEAVNSSSIKLQDLSEPLKGRVEKAATGKNEQTWVYYLFGNALANSLLILMFFLPALSKSVHEVKGKPGILPTMMYKLTGRYLRLFNLSPHPSFSFLNLATALSCPSVGLGFLSFCFGCYTASAVRIIGLRFYLAAIMPHGIFEIPAAIASGAMSLAMLIEIIRLKREMKIPTLGRYQDSLHFHVQPA